MVLDLICQYCTLLRAQATVRQLGHAGAETSTWGHLNLKYTHLCYRFSQAGVRCEDRSPPFLRNNVTTFLEQAAVIC